MINYLEDYFNTSLSAGITAGATSMTLVNAPAGYPTYLVINKDDPTKREIVKVTNISGNVCTLGTRGVGVTSPLPHDQGSSVTMAPVSTFWSDIDTQFTSDVEALHAEVDEHNHQGEDSVVLDERAVVLRNNNFLTSKNAAGNSIVNLIKARADDSAEVGTNLWMTTSNKTYYRAEGNYIASNDADHLDIYATTAIRLGATLLPGTHNVFDVGADATRFKSGYFSDTVYAKDISITGDMALAASKKVSFRTTDIYVASNAAGILDLVANTAIRLNNHLRASTGSTYDLGQTGTRFKDLYLSGTAHVTGDIRVGDNTNNTNYLGMIRVGGIGGGGYVAHRDNFAAANYALAQVSAGDTYVNAKTGRRVYLINNASSTNWSYQDSAGFTASSAVCLAGLSLSATQNANVGLLGTFNDDFAFNGGYATFRVPSYGMGFYPLNTGTNQALGLNISAWGGVNLFAANTLMLQLRNDGIIRSIGIQPFASATHTLGSSALHWQRIYVYHLASTGNIVADSQFVPNTNGTIKLGTSTNRWEELWAANATIQTSDAKRKEALAPVSNGLTLLMKLKPTTFRWKDFSYEAREAKRVGGKDEMVTVTKQTNFKRRHYGLVAQDVAEAIASLGIDSKDFAPLIIDSETGDYGLRYEEFIPILIAAIQEQQATIHQLTGGK